MPTERRSEICTAMGLTMRFTHHDSHTLLETERDSKELIPWSESGLYACCGYPREYTLSASPIDQLFSKSKTREIWMKQQKEHAFQQPSAPKFQHKIPINMILCIIRIPCTLARWAFFLDEKAQQQATLESQMTLSPASMSVPTSNKIEHLSERYNLSRKSTEIPSK